MFRTLERITPGFVFKPHYFYSPPIIANRYGAYSVHGQLHLHRYWDFEDRRSSLSSLRDLINCHLNLVRSVYRKQNSEFCHHFNYQIDSFKAIKFQKVRNMHVFLKKWYYLFRSLKFVRSLYQVSQKYILQVYHTV